MSTTVYFEIVKERQQYLGVKFFAFSHDSDTVLQVCTCPGVELRRGRTNSIGVYTISKMSMATNYIAMGYVTPITKTQYKKELIKMVDALKLSVE